MHKRRVVLDTETTGLSHATGHRIIEIGCIAIAGRQVTDTSFHRYINPQRAVDPGALRVHGLSNNFLSQKPLFQEIIDEFIEFIADSELIIHNAAFDVGFLNAELKRLKHKKMIEDYCTVFDTLVFARKKFPGQRNTLDALCKRYNVDASKRQLHGALLDAQILTDVYLAMTGGQVELFTQESDYTHEIHKNIQQPINQTIKPGIKTCIISPSDDELAAHNA